MNQESSRPPSYDQLDAVELRILGAMIEKGITTPEYYPLTLNSLTAACNQKSNRDPAVAYDEKTVARGLQALRDRGLARTVSGPEMRVPKHYQVMTEVLGLEPAQTAALGVLILRGPQTVGELRSRTARMHEFADLAAVEEALGELINHAQGQLVVLLPRQPGRKEQRYSHTLAPVQEAPAEAPREAPVEPAMAAVLDENARLHQLEEEVVAMRAQLQQLQEEFSRFRDQFE
jgi:uncharacterized protein